MSDLRTPAPGATPAAANSDWQRVARAAALEYGADEGLASEVEMLREMLVFGLDRSAYAVPVERVREIVRMKNLTRVPRAPAWLLGVVALRGEVVEVIDLRRRLGLGASTPTRSNRIIVIHGDIERITGLLVDSVSSVYRAREQDILPAQSGEQSCVREICPREGAFISVLDIERILGGGDG